MRKVFSDKVFCTHESFYNAYKVLSKHSEHHIFLESGRGGRYSICGLSPKAILEGYTNELLIIDLEGNSEKRRGNPLHSMRAWMKEFEIAYDNELPDFQGGAIGFISYDYVRLIEKLPETAEDDLGTPLLYFLIFDEVAVFDQQENVLWLLKIGLQDDKEKCSTRLERMKMDFHQALHQPLSSELKRERNEDDALKVSMTEQEFIAAVEKIKEYIAQGDIFQVNLSVRQSKQLAAHPQEVYAALRQLNPSPYMSYMQTPHFQVVSGSPELLVKRKGKYISTRPIAGTRSRGMTDAEDERLANELVSNEKERAEHIMLVDLERNDIGKVCAYGTVEVNEFMVIEKYSHVMHIVSNVQGKLAPKYDTYDVIDAVFPGGTITGAPKVRTMEIIEELEPVRRGIYTGSIGWIGFNNDMELNIVIRTLFAKDEIGHIQAGAGIVIDSVPKNEYKESLKKAAAVWNAKEIAERQTTAEVDYK